MAITKSNIKDWKPNTLTIGGVDYGALGKDSVKFGVEFDVLDLGFAQSTAVLKKMIQGMTAYLEFTALEMTVSKLKTIIAASGDDVGTATEFTEYSASLTIDLGAETVTISGTVIFDQGFVLDLQAGMVPEQSVRASFMPDTDSSNRLLQLAAA